MTILNLITENPLVSTIVIIITIVGFFFTYQSTPQKKLKFEITDNELITNKQSDLSKLKVFYDEKNVDTLTVTKITMWNAAFSAIKNSDIANTAPLAISISKGDILDVSILKGYDTANQISIQNIEKKPYCINFEYLNKKEGGLIQVVHTGGRNCIDISQTLIGGKIVISKNPNASFFKTLLCSVFATMISIAGVFLFVALGLYIGLSESVIIVSSLLVFIGLIVLAIYIFSRDFVPKNCR